MRDPVKGRHLKCPGFAALCRGVMARLIYFAGSIRAGRTDAVLYSSIVQKLKKYGTVLTEHVGDPNITEAGRYLPGSLGGRGNSDAYTHMYVSLLGKKMNHTKVEWKIW